MGTIRQRWMWSHILFRCLILEPFRNVWIASLNFTRLQPDWTSGQLIQSLDLWPTRVHITKFYKRGHTNFKFHFIFAIWLWHFAILGHSVLILSRLEEGQWIIIHVQELSFPLEILEAHASFFKKKQTLWTKLPAPPESSRKLKTPPMTM